MIEKFQEVLDLQLAHSSENTAEMARRGDLIRNLIPEEMRGWRAAQAQAVLPFRGRLNVQGRDGTGRKTFIPWVRIHSPELSPSAQKGWYVVYLFHARGEGVSLCVSHGSTSFNGRDFVPRSDEEVEALMGWGRGVLAGEAHALGFKQGVNLGSGDGLSKPYERTTAFSKFYASHALPDDQALMLDAEQAVSLLGQLYRAIELGRSPETEAPEIRQAEANVEAIARPQTEASSRSGQGFGLTLAERKAVEEHAMAMAKAWLSDQGFENIRDVSANQSCDYRAVKNGIDHYIEVKGTTAGFGAILLTANEVMLHRNTHPDNVLIVVHDIDLVEMRTKVIGGRLVAFEAWDIGTASLRPLSFSCTLSTE